MPNPATTADIAARWTEYRPTLALVAATRLDDAYDLLVSRRPSLDADVTEGRVSQSTVVRVVADMALRVLKNPDGKFQESIDDYSYSRDAVIASGVLHVTDDELSAITAPPTAGGRRNSVRLVRYADDDGCRCV